VKVAEIHQAAVNLNYKKSLAQKLGQGFF